MTGRAAAQIRASVLIVDDDHAFRTSLRSELEDSRFRVAEAANGDECRARVGQEEPEVLLLDLRLPNEDGLSILEWLNAHASTEVIVLTGHGTVQTAIRAMKLGAADYLTKPCDLDELEIAIDRCLQTRRLRERARILESGLSRSAVEMIGASPRFAQLMQQITKAAASRVNVLVRGESGTGKELIARQLHHLSGAHTKPFVVVDCTALSDELMQSELFGHERGAYTGARDRKHGLFEVADGGTLCLDEIGEIKPAIQAQLLRILDGGTFRRVGGTQEIKVDVRVVSATNRRLEEAVAAGTFREDLYYRLSLLTIEVPPLRDRPSDIPLLAQHFLHRAARGISDAPELDASALAALRDYRWPGNVRELWGVIEQLALFKRGARVTGDDVTSLLRARAPRPSVAVDQDLPLAEVERRHIENVLRRCDGHRAEAADRLGISERTLYRKLKLLGH